ncbi:hypothetical protein JQV19_08340 [Sulfitobacter mediterraneus]|uniref:hypothetical protein n=1 Tax=Sulfitobacter mediterraneus TaxID=83219 RepID=UPI0019394978|nr:hypothetical protein [Sulfitobacter mediterraneus]MBM1556654.1 hypothetical protein [Sulfitobacter mediterraneus]MBM1570150.1 hypothetical protein [Sulfitobacter mediterraneus]MBM1574106.1 hypothetical protein [Sulfitobacter mediterraneus]MBM1577892.1 hypothetical protein [Sulfitobacter mediterraneus]MBM1579612.1 hypothetical protein [Sulfitobacter mediterraneus]
MIFLRPFLPYITGAALAAALASSGALWVQTMRLRASQADKVALALSLGACEARALNLTEDKESDNEVDNIPDDDLRNVPDHWLRP